MVCLGNFTWVIVQPLPSTIKGSLTTIPFPILEGQLCRYTPLVQIELLKMHSSICMDDFSAE